MSQPQCPVCYTPLEVREVTPCFICGGWPGMVERFDPSADFGEYTLPNGGRIVMCRGCTLEEFMVPGGLSERLGLPPHPLPVHALQFLHDVERPQVVRDKFCPGC